MSINIGENKFGILYESDFEDENYDTIELTNNEISLEFIDSKPIIIKRFNKRNNKHKRRLIKVKKNHNVYHEIDNLPKDFTEAIEKKQNLTLKQILVLMNLHGIPGFLLNMIHDNIQTQVKRKHLKIFHNSKSFYVSHYNWYDLKQIEMIINKMLE